MAKEMIVFTAAECQACNSCVVECAVAHSEAGSAAEAATLDPPPQSRVYVEPVEDTGTPVQCQQCDDAPCTIVCKKKALHRGEPDGPVLHDPELCTGCKMCTLVCPYGVIAPSRQDKTVVKCDMCADRPDADGTQACVDSCPVHGLHVVEVEGDNAERHRRVAERVADNHRRRIEAAEPIDGNIVHCEVCGVKMAPVKQLEFIRKKMPDHVPIAAICYRCRRVEAAAALVECAG